MKIAIIRKKYTFHGGAEGFSQNFITRLADAGHEVHIYAIEWSSAHSHRNIYFHKVPAINISSFLRDLTFAVSSYFILKKHRDFFDIIQSHDKTLYQDIYRAGDGCHIEWLRQRWIRTGTAGKLSIIFNPYHWLILALERTIYKKHKFKKIIAISELVKKNIVDHYNVDERDLRVIYNGVDLEKFHPGNKDKYRKEIREKHSIDSDAFVLLFAGSGFERKGLEFLLKAIELCPRPLTVLIVGKGSEKKFKTKTKVIPPHPPLEKGGRGDFRYRQKTIFCGVQKEVQKYYAAADMFLFPAIYEPFGNVHLEALASGLPVITTKLSGASEIISNGEQGFVIEKPENTDIIAEKVLMLMDKDLNLKMSEQARKLAENFSFENHLKEIFELYETVTVSDIMNPR